MDSHSLSPSFFLSLSLLTIPLWQHLHIFLVAAPSRLSLIHNSLRSARWRRAFASFVATHSYRSLVFLINVVHSRLSTSSRSLMSHLRRSSVPLTHALPSCRSFKSLLKSFTHVIRSCPYSCITSTLLIPVLTRASHSCSHLCHARIVIVIDRPGAL